MIIFKCNYRILHKENTSTIANNVAHHTITCNICPVACAGISS